MLLYLVEQRSALKGVSLRHLSIHVPKLWPPLAPSEILMLLSFPLQVLLVLCAMPLPSLPSDSVLHDVPAFGPAQVLLESIHQGPWHSGSLGFPVRGDS